MTARPRHLAAWSPCSRGGVGRGERVRGGVQRARAGSPGGSARAERRQADQGGAGERQAEPGWLPAAQRRSCCVAGLCVPPPLLRLPQNFYSLGPPGVSEGIGALGRLSAPLQRRRPSGPASLARRALAPRASSPADRTPERRGRTRGGVARAPAPLNSPIHRGRPTPRNFNLIPLAQPQYQRLLLPPSPFRLPPPHKGAQGEEAARAAGTGVGAQGAGLRVAEARRQKGNCLCSPCRIGVVCSTASRPAPRSSFPHPRLLLRLPPGGPSPQCSETRQAFGARVAAGGSDSSDNK